MSTPGVIGVPQPGGGWRGRYVANDGYESWLGHALWSLVQREGLEQTRRVLVAEHGAWSYVMADWPDITGVAPAIMSGATAAEEAAGTMAILWADKERFVSVPGYGVARLDIDEWAEPDDDGGGYAYVLADDGLVLAHRGGFAAWDGPEPRWDEDEGA